jgi:hypothetical protein
MLARTLAFLVYFAIGGGITFLSIQGLRAWLRHSNSLSKSILRHPKHWECCSQIYVGTAIEYRDRLARFLIRQSQHTEDFKRNLMQDVDGIIEDMIQVATSNSYHPTLRETCMKLREDVDGIIYAEAGDGETPLDRIKARQDSLKASVTAIQETNRVGK